jgi:phospholipase/lecithinase/hemolysin
LVPDQPYAKGGHHFTNGATWIEQFAQWQGFAGDVRPAFQGNSTKATNYAIGGTRAYVEQGNPTPTFADQIVVFDDRFSGTPLPNALYVIEMGSNDVRDALAIALEALRSGDNMGTAITKAAVRLQAALTEIGNNISHLENNGANKFLILNVPDIGLVPAVKFFGPSASGLATSLTNSFNQGLSSLQALSVLGIDVITLDLFTQSETLVAHPGDFGFTNVDTPCVTPNQPPFTCPKPDTYLFWDGIHPTKAAHAIIAHEATTIISAK